MDYINNKDTGTAVNEASLKVNGFSIQHYREIINALNNKNESTSLINLYKFMDLFGK